MLTGHDGMLAVDIGGSNIRVGVVTFGGEEASSVAAAKVWKSELWRHADDSPNRKEAVARLIKMLKGMISAAEKEKLILAPLIGVGCPGLIATDGSIERGGQNLPGGNWESSKFNLPTELMEALPNIGKHQTTVVLHNDAVVQGLSEVPFMQDARRWGVVTIGTGLGNARYTNRSPGPKAAGK
jgi:predicted NBD/HSP70 family sugar kinase